MIFRQLFDPETSTYSYLLADENSREAVLIDPVLEQFNRDRRLVEELELTLLYTLETHVHADHVTSAARCRKLLGSRIVLGEQAGTRVHDIALRDGQTLSFGKYQLEGRSTPGHTSGCLTYACHSEEMVFSGDTLLIRGCGRTDFQQGSAERLYRSVWEKIFVLPGRYRVYPAHDYRGLPFTTVSEEKRFNPRLKLGVQMEDFIETMAALNLPYPKRMDQAVPANLRCGEVVDPMTPPEFSIASIMDTIGRQDSAEFMGEGI